MAKAADLDQRRATIDEIVKGVRIGRPVVPLVGAGISIEAGVPSLSEVTRYLAKTKAYLRHQIYQHRSPEKVSRYKILKGSDPLPPFRVKPREFLREFGWPDPHELNSGLWHWLWEEAPSYDFHDALNLLVTGEILESIRRLDLPFADYVRGIIAQPATVPKELRLQGSYWKILLTQLTRSSPDLVDTLFQRLTRHREPATAHRFFAFLTPVLRLRLFLTINFDSLLEDALRIEGFRPTVYEVADGLPLPHPKLVQEGLSIVKLHGGAYGLLVGDKLDSPLDEETRDRFQSYLPENLIMLVMGIGGWDQRVLDMVDLAHERQGEVFWLHFEDEPPAPLEEWFHERGSPEKLPKWLKPLRVRDPGAFLREIYSAYKGSHPSSSRPFQVCDLRPVAPGTIAQEARLEGVFHRPDDRLVVYCDKEGDYGLGAARRLAHFVVEKSRTHLPLWIDLETKFTVEDVLVELIQQLRRYDPGLPPEILVMERVGNLGPLEYRKVVRRLYEAMARGRYVLAFNGVRSFGRQPTRHHSAHDNSRSEATHFQVFLSKLISDIDPGDLNRPESLGLLDSVLAFALDSPDEPGVDDLDLEAVLLGRKLETAKPSSVQPGLPAQVDAATTAIDDDEFAAILCNPATMKPATADSEAVRFGGGTAFREASSFPALAPDAWIDQPIFVLLTAMRRRRSAVALHRLMPKYLALSSVPEGSSSAKIGKIQETERVEATLVELREKDYLWPLEGGDYWMSRKLRNRLYQGVRLSAVAENSTRLRALAILAFVHQDLAEYHHRDLYVGTQDVGSLLEEVYHRLSGIRYLWLLEEVSAAAPPFDEKITKWLNDLARPLSRIAKKDAPFSSPEDDLWTDRWSIADRGALDRAALAQRRFRSLRALREVIEEEREALLSRLPSVTLQGWMDALIEEVPRVSAPGGAATEPWSQALREECDRISQVAQDIVIEILQDRMKSLEILERCRKSLDRQLEWLALGDQPAGELDQDATPSAIMLRWPQEDGTFLTEPTYARLERLCSAETSDSWRLRRQVVRALADVAKAIRRSTLQREARDEAASFERAVCKLLHAWLPADPSVLSLDTPRLQGPIAIELLKLKLIQLRLTADQKLWGESPWRSRGQGRKALEKQVRAAQGALQASEQALKILDSISEGDRTERSYFHSLKGRALCLLSDANNALRHGAAADHRHDSAHTRLTAFDDAYREFDLARAGLYATSASEREMLAVALLRQAECLMVHSDSDLVHWVVTLFSREDLNLKRGDWKWSRLISSEGHHKLALSRMTAAEGVSEDEGIRVLLRLSLANWSPQFLDLAEAAVRNTEMHRRELTNTLGAMRSRLAAARDLLDRVELLLESSRSNVEFWACLFQLRAQLAVERLLLLISGDLTPATGLAAERRAHEIRSTLEEGELWRPVQSWLHGGPPTKSASAGWEVSANADLQRRFIHRFQGLLRQGVMAVRQGLDIVLPNDAGRQFGRLKQDVLLRRLLRCWTELMICGAHATSISQKTRPQQNPDDNQSEWELKRESQKRWEQWRYLNWLSGLTTLPDCKRLETWFQKRHWSIDRPGLASRARTLARIDLSLAASTGDAGSALASQWESDPYEGGNAVRYLCEKLEAAGALPEQQVRAALP